MTLSPQSKDSITRRHPDGTPRAMRVIEVDGSVTLLPMPPMSGAHYEYCKRVVEQSGCGTIFFIPEERSWTAAGSQGATPEPTRWDRVRWFWHDCGNLYRELWRDLTWDWRYASVMLAMMPFLFLITAPAIVVGIALRLCGSQGRKAKPDVAANVSWPQ